MFNKKEKEKLEKTNFEDLQIGDKYLVTPSYTLLSLVENVVAKDKIVYEIMVTAIKKTKVTFE